MRLILALWFWYSCCFLVGFCSCCFFVSIGGEECKGSEKKKQKGCGGWRERKGMDVAVCRLSFTWRFAPHGVECSQSHSNLKIKRHVDQEATSSLLFSQGRKRTGNEGIDSGKVLLERKLWPIISLP